MRMLSSAVEAQNSCDLCRGSGVATGAVVGADHEFGLHLGKVGEKVGVQFRPEGET